MSGSIRPGCVIHWKDYTFADGAKADKYFVILGCKQGSNYLAVIGTSKAHRRSFSPGCHHADGYYHCPAGKAWFPKDTWLLLADPVELDPAQFLKFSLVDKSISISGHMRDDMANAIRNCLRLCADVSDLQRALL